ncbi:MAG: HAMP domain-containing protein [Caldilineaceae bacterium]|nr:HAMP domain-containing protein [Caldilineaceae bacterium]
MSLRHKILLLLLAIMVPIALLLSSGIYHFVANNERSVWQSRQSDASTFAAAAVYDFLVRIQDLLYVVGAHEHDVVEEHSELLNTYLANNPAILEIILTDPSGRSIGNAFRDKPLLGDLFTLPQSRWFAVAKAGGMYVGGLQVAADNDPYIVMAAPATGGGTVAARVKMDILWDVVGNISFGKSGHAYVVTADGGIIAHPDPAVVLAHTTLQDRPELFLQTTTPDTWSGNYENFEGIVVQSVARAIPGTDWTIVAEVPISEAQSTSRLAVTFFLFGVLLFGTLVIAPIYWALRRLVIQPLATVRAGALEIASGNLNYRIDLPQRDEIGQLAADFNVMVGELQARNVELSAKTDALSAEVIEHQATQAALRSLNETLEARIAERTRDLEAANQDLIRSNRELQEFAFVASHDLQEPLRKIQAFGDRLLERYAPLLDERGQDYLRRMQASSERLQTLIDALLTYSRITTKAQPFVPTDLNQIAVDVLADLDTRIAETGGRVCVGELATVCADPLQMRLLIQNLVGNALKFHHPERSPHVTVTGAWRDNQDVSSPNGHDVRRVYALQVSDNGIGFERDYAERIFQMFQRLHGRSEYEGTGVGLAICRKIVERHGGTIVATAEPGRGATFMILLPERQAATAPSTDEQRMANNGQTG